jgi:hypothetical protein
VNRTTRTETILLRQPVVTRSSGSPKGGEQGYSRDQYHPWRTPGFEPGIASYYRDLLHSRRSRRDNGAGMCGLEHRPALLSHVTGHGPTTAPRSRYADEIRSPARSDRNSHNWRRRGHPTGRASRIPKCALSHGQDHRARTDSCFDLETPRAGRAGRYVCIRVRGLRRSSVLEQSKGSGYAPTT